MRDHRFDVHRRQLAPQTTKVDPAETQACLRKIARSNVWDAFTLVELLVVLAIIAALVSALLPAIQAARGSARRTQCKGNMVQLAMALQNFEMAHTHYPAGVTDPSPGPISHTESGLHQSWLISMLPYLDEGYHRSQRPDGGKRLQRRQCRGSKANGPFTRLPRRLVS